MARYRALLAYDGAAYQGFQRQAGDAPTVQAALEAILEQLCGSVSRLTAAGRTDAGVHAEGQVIAFDVDWPHGPQALQAALNAHLPEDLAVRALEEASGFHPRYDARSRTYRYQIVQARQRQPLLRQQAWWIAFPLRHEAMQQAAAALLGEQDFGAFGRAPHGENTVRTVYQSKWSVEAESERIRLIYRIEANAFLHHMVRRLVGTMVDVGRGKLAVEEFIAILRSGDRTLARRMAPAHGLVLESVRYTDGWPGQNAQFRERLTGGGETVGGNERS